MPAAEDSIERDAKGFKCPCFGPYFIPVVWVGQFYLKRLHFTTYFFLRILHLRRGLFLILPSPGLLLLSAGHHTFMSLYRTTQQDIS